MVFPWTQVFSQNNVNDAWQQMKTIMSNIMNKHAPLVERRIKGRSCLWLNKGGFPVMAEITRILAANIRRQFFFVITTTASTRYLVQNFQLICYSQRVNATSQYNDSGSSTCSKWPNDWMVAVVKHCWLLVQGKRGCRER